MFPGDSEGYLGPGNGPLSKTYGPSILNSELSPLEMLQRLAAALGASVTKDPLEGNSLRPVGGTGGARGLLLCRGGCCPEPALIN